MKPRYLLIGVVLGVVILACAIVWQASPSVAQGPAAKSKPVDGPLPIRQVVLFNSGVCYIQREGEVDGNSRVDLNFPASDINDLLKSLVLQDLGGGLISTVSYDSHDPIDKILRGFALDLTNNPTFGQILNQARGEKIEISLVDKKLSKFSGTMVGMETQRLPAGKGAVSEVEILNLAGPNGLQSIPLAQVAGVRFLNPILENEFHRALRVLAASHDVQKKQVSLGFNGAGRRAVRVGYVVERPIWKTSYRLRLEPNGKLFLQGWAIVDNSSDDDWNDVRMVLVSGKPISYQMNLYEPLYIPRPVVEPELFASLRPPVYNGALDTTQGNVQLGVGTPVAEGGGQFGIGGIGGFGGLAGAGGMQGGRGLVGFGGQFGQGGQAGQFGQFNFQGGVPGMPPANRFQPGMAGNIFAPNNRLTYEELQKRRNQKAEDVDEAKKAGRAITAMNFKEGIQSVATAEEAGDYFQYVLDQKITLSRQKSAMVPILDQTIEGEKVSIYNETIHGKYPLLGLRLKNTSDKPLTQGPITVYDGGNYVGDTRILHLQPGEERLLSYALDQDTESKTATTRVPGPTMNLRLDEPVLTARFIMRETKTYTFRNRSKKDRALILEHPIRTDWKLVGVKPSEKTRDVYRFTVKVPAGKTSTIEVAEEQPYVDQFVRAGKDLPYASAFGVAVKAEQHRFADEMIGLKIQKGLISATARSRVSKTYFIQNHSEEDRDFVIDHAIPAEYALVSDKGERLQAGPDAFRFKLAVPKGTVAAKELKMESIVTEKGRDLRSTPGTLIRNYLAHPTPSGAVKAGLAKVVQLVNQVEESANKLSEIDKQANELAKDQARLRSNLQIIPQSSEPYKKFLEKFVTQENEIENIQRQTRQLHATLQTQKSAYEEFIAGLSAD